MKPINSKIKLNISVCGKKKLDKYEISIRKKIPYTPINPMSLSEEFNKYLLNNKPYPTIENIIIQ